MVYKFMAALALSAAAISAPAHAGDLHLSMTFQSGATFNGTVSFTGDYSAVTNVSGILHGYAYGGGFDGTSDDSINWVWSNGDNFSSGPGNYSTFLMDGPGSGYTSTGGFSHWIQLAYNYDSAPTLLFTSGVSSYGTDNFVDYQDPLVSGSFGNVAGVPEPASWALMLGGFGLVGSAMRRRRVSLSFA